MPKRSAITLAEVATWDTLNTAFWRAAKGRRQNPAVREFSAHLDKNLRAVQHRILNVRAPLDQWTVFHIRDPKPRRILAPCFPDRVLHHALMAKLGPVLDRALIADTYACRTGKGSLAAVHRVQHAVRRWPWVVKTDVRAYFASINPEILHREVLQRRFKDPGVLALCHAITQRWPGLPIGALTSQFFANSYLDAVDRFVCEQLRVPLYVRYMDDLVWACHSQEQARETYAAVRGFTAKKRGLDLKPPLMTRSVKGIPFLGFQIRPGSLRLSQRRRQRYRAARKRWEGRYLAGDIDANALQMGYAAAYAITRHADALSWHRQQLRLHPAVDA